MKRHWAVLLTAGILVGCRSSQPATNPFLRTTVPPPGTGATAPGDPYYPPPMQGVPAAPPGVAAPAAPAAVPLGAPPVAAPPVATPPGDNRYAPPGGSFQYNQSSLDRSTPGASQGRDHPANDTSLAASANRNAEDIPDADDPVRQAVLLSREDSPVGQASYRASVTRRSPNDEAQSVPTDLAAGGPSDAVPPANNIRILGSSSAARDVADVEPADDQKPQSVTTLHISAGDSSSRETANQSPVDDRRATASPDNSQGLSWKTAGPAK